MPIKPEYKASDFTVGQEIWVVAEDKRHAPRMDVVVKVGVKYLTLKRFNTKFDLKTIYEGGYGGQQGYVDKQDWLNLVEAKRLANEITVKLKARTYRGESLPTLDQLQRMTAILNEGAE